MFPSEMIILLSLALSGGYYRTSICHPMDVMNEYIGYLYSSLIKRGYVRKSGPKGYKLTTKGNEALLIFLNENTTKARDIMYALRQLSIESSQKIEELGKEVVGMR